MMRVGVVFVVLMLLTGARAQSVTVVGVVPETFFLAPRDAMPVLRQPVIAHALGRLAEAADAVLEIAFPGGEEGRLWAGDLRDRLVALGLESNRIQLSPATGGVSGLVLRIRP